ncbi:hypothetical protein DEU34_0619 [Microbacterium sp. AG1240]|uniref:hypothetical protein n=1 Tax=Microbacterium sp. AG1240 TaxID=2183992 RepID=UPI000EB45BA8|nr:hypothetical protein [Microbacterium sp. AG1240]RKT36112.1 hypothetical protein DEU34_0619 [Microbacterium sp. AG1240]
MLVSNTSAPVIVCALPGFAERVGPIDGEVDVRHVELADLDHVIAQLASCDGRRFVVAGGGAEAAVVAAVVERLLSGEAPVFGLVGVVLAEPEGDLGTESFDLPTLVIPDAATRLLRSAASDGAQHMADEASEAVRRTFPRARAGELAEFIAREIAPAPAVPEDWARLIASDRVDVEVRSILSRRALPDDAEYAPREMDAAQLTLLREIADLVVPQDGPAIDLAARVDAQLARGEGDGWRNAALPPDPDAYRTGLTALADRWAGEETLRSAIEGELETGGPFSAAQLMAWLEDVRVDLVRQWLAHPATAAKAGFDGFATGGTVLPLRGFTELGSATREAWEPAGVNA